MRRDPRCRSNRWSPGRWGAGRLMRGIKAIFLKIFSGHSGIFFNFKQFQRWCWGSNRWSLERWGADRLMRAIKAPQDEFLENILSSLGNSLAPLRNKLLPSETFLVSWRYFLIPWNIFWPLANIFCCWVEGRADGQLWKRCNLNILWRQIGTHCLKVAQ